MKWRMVDERPEPFLPTETWHLEGSQGDKVGDIVIGKPSPGTRFAMGWHYATESELLVLRLEGAIVPVDA